jgi:hypothetical protein
MSAIKQNIQNHVVNPLEIVFPQGLQSLRLTDNFYIFTSYKGNNCIK